MLDLNLSSAVGTMIPFVGAFLGSRIPSYKAHMDNMDSWYKRVGTLSS